METIGPLADTMDATLTTLRRSFPGMSSDEWDAFVLGYWGGAMAFGINAGEENLTSADVADRIEAELKRIEGDSPPG
jgi:hypothetical protein